jgi:hypothetical protein
MNTKEYLENIVDKYGLHFKDRQRELVYQRFAFCYYARSLGYPLSTIGKFINRGHATVIHALEQAQNLLDVNDPLYAESTYYLQLDLELCPKPMRTRKKENIFVTILKRINELPYSPESESLKAFVNENINPEKIK